MLYNKSSYLQLELELQELRSSWVVVEKSKIIKIRKRNEKYT